MMACLPLLIALAILLLCAGMLIVHIGTSPATASIGVALFGCGALVLLCLAGTAFGRDLGQWEATDRSSATGISP